VFATTLRPGPADLIEVMRNITLDELVKSVAIPAGALSLPPNKLVDSICNIPITFQWRSLYYRDNPDFLQSLVE
jgi:hypothetical protein